MRRLLLAFSLIASPISVAAAEEADVQVARESEALPLPDAMPDELTPAAMSAIAAKIDKLSQIRLVRIVREPGGRKSADKRRTASLQAKQLAKKLQDAADALGAAQAGQQKYTTELAAAEASALSVAKMVATEIRDLDLSRELFDLLDGPPPKEPDPITYVFCIEASGAGPLTFSRYAQESLTGSIPYVQGYISHELSEPAQRKLRLQLTVEHDADAAPFSVIDAMQVANRFAISQREDADERKPSETILMGDLAERLCSPTAPRGQ